MKYTAFLLSTVLLSSCATIFNRAKPTTITTSPSGANVVITDKNQVVVHKGVSPTSVQLKASDGYFKAASYQVNVSKKGYPTRTIDLHAGMSGWYFGNILIGGLIGMVIIDPATGCMWKMPQNYDVQLKTMVTLHHGGTSTLAVVDHASLSPEQIKHLIPVSANL